MSLHRHRERQLVQTVASTLLWQVSSAIDSIAMECTLSMACLNPTGTNCLQSMHKFFWIGLAFGVSRQRACLPILCDVLVVHNQGYSIWQSLQQVLCHVDTHKWAWAAHAWQIVCQYIWLHLESIYQHCCHTWSGCKTTAWDHYNSNLHIRRILIVIFKRVVVDIRKSGSMSAFVATKLMRLFVPQKEAVQVWIWFLQKPVLAKN